MNHKLLKNSLVGLFIFGLIFVVTSCGDSNKNNGNDVMPDTSSDTESDTNTDTDSDVTEAITPVVINEIDVHGRDWIELINTSETESADLSGWILTDKLDNPEHHYALPSGSILEPGEFLVIKEEKPEEGEPGFSYGIKSGETIHLINPEGITAAEVVIGEIPDDITWGRYPDKTGSWQLTLPTQGDPNRLPGESSEMLFEEGQINTINITLSEESWTSLEQEPFTYTEATFQLSTSDEIFTTLTVGLRLKSGHSFQSISEKAAFKIKFNEFSNQTFMGLKGVTLNNMVEDPTMLRETLSYHIFREFGLPAPRTTYVWVRVNDNDYGLYLLLEKYDEIFLQNHFDSTNHLYEGSVDLTLDQLDQFEVDEGDSSDITDLETFVETIHNAPDEQWISEVSQTADLSNMVRFWAVENYIGHVDGFSMAFNNYYLHSDEQGIFSLLPWGTDRTFTESGNFPEFPGGSAIMVSKCMALSDCHRLYTDQLGALHQTVITLELDSMVTNLLDTVSPYIEDDSRKPYNMEEHNQAVEDLGFYLDER